MRGTDDANAPTQLVRGEDGRWRAVEVGSPTPDPAPDHNRTAAATAEPGSDQPLETPGPAPEGGATQRETGPFVRRLAIVAPDRPGHVVVTGDSGQPVSQLAAELGRVAGTGPDTLRIDDQPLPTDGNVEALGLRDGQVVDAGAPTAVDAPPEPGTAPPPTTGPVLRVIGGPEAGRVIPLRVGDMTIGRAKGNTVRLADPNASRSHAVVRRDAEGVTLIDLGSANGTRVEGVPHDEVRLASGDVVRLGDTLLEFGDARDLEHVRLEAGHGFVGLHRRFRAGTTAPATRLRHPRKRDPGEPQPLNLLMAILPAGGIAAMALVFGRPTMLIFAAMSPLLAVGRAIASKRNHRQRTIQSAIDYRKALGRFRTDLAAMRAAERHHRRRELPDPARVVEAATHPTTELWSRRAADADALTLRVGSASAPTGITVDAVPDEDAAGGTDADQPWLPVGVPLLEAGGLALVGPLDRLRPLASGLVLQAAVLHAPSELQIAFLGGADAETAWSWLRWLPHLRRGRLDPSLMMGTDPGTRSLRIEELRRILNQRREIADGRETVFTPRLLVIHDDASARLSEGVSELLREGPAVGIHALTLDTLQVPEGCDASLALGDRVDGARLERKGHAPVRGVITDAMDPARAEMVARRLAPLQVIGEDADDGLPTSCRLLSTLDIEPTADAVATRWRTTSPSSRAVIGVGPERPLSLDLTRDGPHGLVAGTTGAGKSEFIKTFVASLALENHPDHLMFLFIDFKGGGDYRTLMRLPHTVDLATNLDDPAALDRTLQLLEAEMGRRIAMLQRAGTPSIEGYMATAAARSAPMPRLVVVADEFAELKDKAPKHLDRLVSVARTGRSVGVHLLLATQRPGGVVTSQIDANVGLRVCFRVKDEQESKEIIDSPLAGRIAERHRGRCYFRSAATPLTEAQTARVAGPRPGARSAAPIRVVPLAWDGLGRPFPKGAGGGEVPDADTDLHDVVEAVRVAATATGWTGGAIPWPRELPESLARAALPASEDPLLIGVGLVDVPESQRQELIGVRLGAGHVVIAGSGRTGRTTALRGLVVGAVERLGPSDLHIAALDFGGGSLMPVQQLPHCIGASMEDLDAAEAIVDGLERELARRRELFARHGWPDLPAQRAQADVPLPWLLLLLEGWDNLAEEGMKQGLPMRVAQLLARGGPQGLQVLMTGDRGTTHSMVARHLTHRFSLRFNRAVDAELQGIMARELPAHQPPGRAVEIATKRVLQFAELDDPDGVGQGVAFQRALAAAAVGHGGDVAAAPASLSDGAALDQLLANGPPDDLGFPVLLGLGDEPREPVWADAATTGGLLFVVGPGGTGRSTALRAMGEAARGPDTDIVVIGPDGSGLVADPPAGAVRRALDGPAEAFLPPAGRRLLVLVDDLDLLDDGRPAQEALGGAVPNRAVVVAADIDWMKVRFTGLAAAARRPRKGIILSPSSPANGVEMFAVRLDRTLIKPPVPGRAVANLGAGPVLLQVPRAGGGEEISPDGEVSPPADA